MREAVIVSSVRTAVGKAPRGALKDTRPDELGALAVREAVRRVPGLSPDDVEDCILGCALPEAEQGLNMARAVALRAGLPITTAGMTINRFCSSGLQAIAIAAQQIMAGQHEVVVAGGTESMSLVPMQGNKYAPNPHLAEHWPDVYLNMGLTAEIVAQRYQVSREEQDRFALRSHRNATAAQQANRFDDELVPVPTTRWSADDGRPRQEAVTLAADEGVRADTSLDALSKLRPVFARDGTVTAGNSSQTSDGAAAAVVMSADRAHRMGLAPLALFRSFAVAGVSPEEMGIGPVRAIPKALAQAGLRLRDIGLIELNEAFAAQALAVIKLADLDPELVNVNGGAIALGHPLGCTGAKLTATLLREMRRRQVRYGMVTMCIGGGQGAAGIFELA
ncbi:MAG: acetyl-CoA C-acyltransferase [Armatimonadota bacterium]|nr:acetyl-CoA C-acyltransferase [Armatimonadota bacterium]MDR7454090.1 acetyl-CoA C-acyltransferase [Armatimonadota bacterium]MDR7498061.1 acetyl-CoA C-acyltransferase [Armatimonadota bacterium]MDR7511461.1 acetyl-CoA C-acyltransferase [Armatimonadota bacterium]